MGEKREVDLRHVIDLIYQLAQRRLKYLIRIHGISFIIVDKT
jgi:hypothetical protein